MHGLLPIRFLPSRMRSSLFIPFTFVCCVLSRPAYADDVEQLVDAKTGFEQSYPFAAPGCLGYFAPNTRTPDEKAKPAMAMHHSFRSKRPDVFDFASGVRVPMMTSSPMATTTLPHAKPPSATDTATPVIKVIVLKADGAPLTTFTNLYIDFIPPYWFEDLSTSSIAQRLCHANVLSAASLSLSLTKGSNYKIWIGDLPDPARQHVLSNVADYREGETDTVVLRLLK